MHTQLLRLKPHAHRDGAAEIMAVVSKAVKHVRDDAVELGTMRIQIHFLNTPIKSSEIYTIHTISAQPTFDVVVDHRNKTIDFDVGDRKVAIPEALQGGGLGSFILSEMIEWVQQVDDSYQVEAIRVGSPESVGSGREQKLKAFFSRFGFSIVERSGQGVLAVIDGPRSLKPCINGEKIESVALVRWGNELVAEKVKLSNQLAEESHKVRLLKEQMDQVRVARSGNGTFWAGLLIGVATGLFIGVLIGVA